MHVQQFWSFFFFSPTDNFWERKHLVLARLCTVLGRVTFGCLWGCKRYTIITVSAVVFRKGAVLLVFKGEKIKTKKTRIIQFNEWNVPCFLVNFWCGWALLLGDFSEQFLHHPEFFLFFLHNFFQAKKKKHFTPYPPQSPAITRRTRNHSPQPTPN